MASHQLDGNTTESFTLKSSNEATLRSRGYQSSGNLKRELPGSNDSPASVGTDARLAKRHCPLPQVPPSYGCAVCGSQFTELSDLSNHFERNQAACGNIESRWKCGLCDEQFTAAKSLTRHGKKGSYACGMCDATYNRSDNLRKHQNKGRCGQNRLHETASGMPKIQSKMSHSVPTSESQDGNVFAYPLTDTPGQPSHQNVVSSPAVKLPPTGTSSLLTDNYPQERLVTDHWRHDSLLCSPATTEKYCPPISVPAMPDVNDIESDKQTVNEQLGNVSYSSHTECASPASAEGSQVTLGVSELVQSAIPSKPSRHNNMLVLPIRPKHAGTRPGPSEKLVKCPSCHSMIGRSRQELSDHARLHPGRFMAQNFCLDCGICFEREKDFQRHAKSVLQDGTCGFVFEHPGPCHGHHPRSEELEAHQRMRQAVLTVPKFDFERTKYDLFRLGEVVEALPDQGDDSERWTISHVSLKSGFARSLISQPNTKWSAPSHIDYATKLSRSVLSERFARFNWRTSSEHRRSKKEWQTKCRQHLSMIGAIMRHDSKQLCSILRGGYDSNHLLYTANTPAASIRYSNDVKLKDLTMTPLTFASEQGFYEGVDALISFGADLNTEDEGRHTPLHWATIRGNWRVCVLLLSHGALLVPHEDCTIESVVQLLQEAKDQLQRASTASACDSYIVHGYSSYHEPLDADDVFFTRLLDQVLPPLLADVTMRERG